MLTPDSIIPDPVDPQSLNRYTYARNNPLKYTDPTGHCFELEGSSDGLCVRTDSRGELIQIVQGGSVYVNYFEVLVENAHLSGNWAPVMSVLSQGGSDATAVDAIGLGLSCNVGFDTPFAGANAVAGREEVIVPYTGSRTTFIYVGGEISVGPNGGFVDWIKRLALEDNARPNVSVSPYVAPIYNVDNVVADYSGPFVYETTTVALRWGATWGEAYSPYDEGVPVSSREYAYSNIYGLTRGYALTGNLGTVYYVPVMTREPGQLLPTLHWREWRDAITLLSTAQD